MTETDILSGSLTTAYRLGWDAGRAGLVSRPPFMGEHAQWLWRNGYAAGVASIEATECECLDGADSGPVHAVTSTTEEPTVSTYIVTSNGGGLDRLSDHARQTVDSEDEARRAMISMILADADYADEIGMHDLAEDLTAMAEDTNLARFGADGTIVTFGSFAYSAQRFPR